MPSGDMQYFFTELKIFLFHLRVSQSWNVCFQGQKVFKSYSVACSLANRQYWPPPPPPPYLINPASKVPCPGLGGKLENPSSFPVHTVISTPGDKSQTKVHIPFLRNHLRLVWILLKLTSEIKVYLKPFFSCTFPKIQVYAFIKATYIYL